MSEFGFRMYFGDRAATLDELSRIEEIVVEQETDMAWEARIRFYMCLDENGQWQHVNEEFTQPFSRVRVEIGSGSSFVPLIDGPISFYESALDSQPGRSSVTLFVLDDSVFLTREESSEVFENKSDDAIAREIYGRFPEIAATRIEPAGGPQPATVRRGTAMQFLLERARVHEYHAYVLPGSAAGQSIGCFLPDPAETSSLPALVLIGSNRNLADVEVQENSAGPETSRAHTLRISDQQLVSSDATQQDLPLIGTLPPPAGAAPATRLVPPEENDREDPAERTAGQQRRSSYAYTVTGRVVPGCYGGVLTPYQRVSVRVGSLPLSGDWLLTRVIHTITPSVYTQEFEAKTDSRSEPEAAAAGLASAAGGLSASASASLSIF